MTAIPRRIVERLNPNCGGDIELTLYLHLIDILLPPSRLFALVNTGSSDSVRYIRLNITITDAITMSHLPLAGPICTALQ